MSDQDRERIMQDDPEKVAERVMSKDDDEGEDFEGHRLEQQIADKVQEKWVDKAADV
ncbi:MAG: hypothetical protein OEW31_04015 [Thermoleophilia bacterium]|nr:hypothetical protein [Thermoleophilia bacterium]